MDWISPDDPDEFDIEVTGTLKTLLFDGATYLALGRTTGTDISPQDPCVSKDGTPGSDMAGGFQRRIKAVNELCTRFRKARMKTERDGDRYRYVFYTLEGGTKKPLPFEQESDPQFGFDTLEGMPVTPGAVTVLKYFLWLDDETVNQLRTNSKD